MSWRRLLTVMTKHVGLSLFFAAFKKIYIKISQIMNKIDVKTNCKYIRNEFNFSDFHRRMNAMGPVQSDCDARKRFTRPIAAKSNLVAYAFVWEKGKTMDFSGTIIDYDIKVGRYSQLNE